MNKRFKYLPNGIRIEEKLSKLINKGVEQVMLENRKNKINDEFVLESEIETEYYKMGVM